MVNEVCTFMNVQCRMINVACAIVNVVYRIMNDGHRMMNEANRIMTLKTFYTFILYTFRSNKIEFQWKQIKLQEQLLKIKFCSNEITCQGQKCITSK